MALRHAVTASADYAYSRDSCPIMEVTLSLSPPTVTTLLFLVSAAVAYFHHLGISCWNAVYSVDVTLAVLRRLYSGIDILTTLPETLLRNQWFQHASLAFGQGCNAHRHVRPHFSALSLSLVLRGPLLGNWQTPHCNHPSSVLFRGRYPSLGHWPARHLMHTLPAPLKSFRCVRIGLRNLHILFPVSHSVCPLRRASWIRIR
jgi:hypothetical protein